MNKIVLAFSMLIVGLVVVFGLYLFLKGARRIQLAAASTKWPTTAGKVVSSQTTRDVSTYRNNSTVTFDTETVIHYTVNGQDYTTDVLHFGQTLGSGDKSDAALQRLRFPAGKEVPVSYDPARSRNRCDEAGSARRSFLASGRGTGVPPAGGALHVTVAGDLPQYRGG